LPYWSIVVALAGVLAFGCADEYSLHTPAMHDAIALDIGFALVVGCAMVAIVMAVVGLRRTVRGGRGRASARIGVIFGVLMLIMFGGAFGTQWLAAHQQARLEGEHWKLHRIGDGLLLYASNDPAGEFPSDLRALLRKGDVSADDLVSGLSEDTPAPGKTPAEQASHLLDGGHLSFVYIGGGVKADLTGQSEDDDDIVVMYEPLALRHGVGSEMLFADGHAEYLSRAEAEPIIRAVESGVRPVHRYSQPATRP
jgi:prepilin-type processing-associated H-X9-DG protein